MPSTVPSGTEKLTPSTATVSPKCLTRPSASMAGGVVIGAPAEGSVAGELGEGNRWSRIGLRRAPEVIAAHATDPHRRPSRAYSSTVPVPASPAVEIDGLVMRYGQKVAVTELSIYEEHRVGQECVS